jgi:hypothetical protein
MPSVNAAALIVKILQEDFGTNVPTDSMSRLLKKSQTRLAADKRRSKTKALASSAADKASSASC